MPAPSVEGVSDGRFAIRDVFQIDSHILDHPAPDASALLTIGQTEGGNNFAGAIDEVEIFDRGLTATEVNAIFNAGSAGRCKPK